MQQLRCTKCGESKPEDQFALRQDISTGRSSHCKACKRLHWVSYKDERNKIRRETREKQERTPAMLAAARRYRQTHKQRISDNQRRRLAGLRLRVFNKYGGVCSCCGEGEYKFLGIDHINGGGRKEREELSCYGVYRKLDKSPELLDGYRVLCHNCNMAIGFYGACPHAETPLVDASTPSVLASFIAGAV